MKLEIKVVAIVVCSLVCGMYVSAADTSYDAGFVWDATHLIGKKSTNPDSDKLGAKDVWHYLYTIAGAENAEKYGEGYRPFERSYGKRKYFLDSKLPIGGGNPCIRTTGDETILEFKSSRHIKPVTLGWQSPVDGIVSLKASVIVEGEDGRFAKAKGKLSILHGENQLHEAIYDPGKGENVQVEKISVKKGDFVYISVQGQLFIGNIGVELLDAQ